MPDVDKPSWMTTEFMETVLRKSFQKEKFKIKESEVKMGAAVGEHYGSQMFRYNFTDQNNKKSSVIVKTLPKNAVADHMDVSIVFEEEIFAYSTVIPAVNSFLKKIYPQDEQLTADCYYHEKKPNCVLILEDLRLGGFTLGDRFNGLDEDHGVLVVKSLAKFHAGSLAVLEQNPEILKNHESSLWSRRTDILQSILKTPFVGLIRDLPNWPEFEKKDYYLQKLKNLQDVVLDKVFEAWKVNEKRVNVCLHGDSWSNNFMFRYDGDGAPTAIKLLDFQILGFGSPVMDLQYFIFSSIKPEHKFDRLDYFLEKYCESFEETVGKLGVKVRLGVEDLRRDFEEKCFWGFMVLCSIYPLVSAPKEDIFDPTDYFEQEQGLSFEKTFKREDVRKVLIKAFEYYDNKGIL